MTVAQRTALHSLTTVHATHMKPNLRLLPLCYSKTQFTTLSPDLNLEYASIYTFTAGTQSMLNSSYNHYCLIQTLVPWLCSMNSCLAVLIGHQKIHIHSSADVPNASEMLEWRE